MKTAFDGRIEFGRITQGPFASAHGEPYGAFKVLGPCGRELAIIASDGIDSDPALSGWQHVSVSLASRPPNWQEMNWVKEHFWNDDETVVQFHPKRSQYVNNHPNCLHLWRRTGADYELPPTLLV
jgi:hypothetical protein